jgi:hypothetical protein
VPYFGKFQKAIVESFAPWFLRGKNYGRFLQAIGAFYDGAFDTLMMGLKLSMPLRCDESALPHLALDRGIRLYDTEPIPSQRYRLSQWWQLHRQRGSHQGEMRHLRPYFLGADGLGVLPRIRIVHQSNEGTPTCTWHLLDGDGIYTWEKVSPSNFDFDGQRSKWSRFWVFIEARDAGYSIANVYNDGHTWDDGSLYDVGNTKPVTSAIAADWINMIADWHASHSWLAGVALVWQSDTVGPSITPTQDPSGWWSLPGGAGAGSWADPINRPPYITFIYDNPG